MENDHCFCINLILILIIHSNNHSDLGAVKRVPRLNWIVVIAFLSRDYVPTFRLNSRDYHVEVAATKHSLN